MVVSCAVSLLSRHPVPWSAEAEEGDEHDGTGRRKKRQRMNQLAIGFLSKRPSLWGGKKTGGLWCPKSARIINVESPHGSCSSRERNKEAGTFVWVFFGWNEWRDVIDENLSNNPNLEKRQTRKESEECRRPARQLIDVSFGPVAWSNPRPFVYCLINPPASSATGRGNLIGAGVFIFLCVQLEKRHGLRPGQLLLLSMDRWETRSYQNRPLSSLSRSPLT